MRAASLVLMIALGCREQAAPEPAPATQTSASVASTADSPRAGSPRAGSSEVSPPSTREVLVVGRSSRSEERDGLALAPTEPLRIASGTTFPPGTFEHDALLLALRRTSTRQFKPTGTSAVVFRTRLRSEHSLAFKPRTRTHRDGWQREIAAYRIGRLLGLDNVPPATARSLPIWEIRDRMHPDFVDVEARGELLARLVPEPTEQVPGAAIYWVPGLTDLGLDRGRALAEWRAWLSQDGPSCPEDKRALCRDLSNMLAFDYLVANWDRFSGGNVQGIETEAGPRVVIRDHDVTLASGLPRELHARILERLGWTERFSRGLVDALRRLDRATLDAAFADESAAAPLLSDMAVDQLFERRATLLSYVGALTDRYGEDAVLVFD